MARPNPSSLESGKKRKLKDLVPQSSKKSRTAATGSPREVRFQDYVLELEEKVLESRSNYNSIPTLLEFCQEYDGANDEHTVAAVALCRLFCRLMARGNLSKPQENSGSEATICQWLREKLRDYEQELLRMLRNENVGRQSIALTIIVRLIKEKASCLNLSEDLIWQNGLFGQLVQTLIEKEVTEQIRVEFVEKYVDQYNDIRYHTFTRLADLASQTHSDAHAQNILMLLATIETIPDQQKRTETFCTGPPKRAKHDVHSLTAQKKQAQKTWMALLHRDLSKSQRKSILELMSHRIAPWFLKVELLMDFLTDCFSIGGAISLLSLSGLFYLIQHKNLDYPQFYQKLYSLLDSNLLHSKQRSRFFRLLDTFLVSTHLPAALVASFIKRLARLSLFAPPTAIVVVVPWIYNLLKGHPSCTFMISRDGEVDQDEEMWGDPFREKESDPMNTDAIESSLWEIQMLQSHYHPNVATIANIISDQFAKQAYNLEDFLDHSYGTMLDAELSKDIKKPPEIEYEIPRNLLIKNEANSAKADSLLVKIWSFA